MSRISTSSSACSGTRTKPTSRRPTASLRWSATPIATTAKNRPRKFKLGQRSVRGAARSREACGVRSLRHGGRGPRPGRRGRGGFSSMTYRSLRSAHGLHAGLRDRRRAAAGVVDSRVSLAVGREATGAAARHQSRAEAHARRSRHRHDQDGAHQESRVVSRIAPAPVRAPHAAGAVRHCAAGAGKCDARRSALRPVPHVSPCPTCAGRARWSPARATAARRGSSQKVRRRFRRRARRCRRSSLSDAARAGRPGPAQTGRAAI